VAGRYGRVDRGAYGSDRYRAGVAARRHHQPCRRAECGTPWHCALGVRLAHPRRPRHRRRAGRRDLHRRQRTVPGLHRRGPRARPDRSRALPSRRLSQSHRDARRARRRAHAGRDTRARSQWHRSDRHGGHARQRAPDGGDGSRGPRRCRGRARSRREPARPARRSRGGPGRLLGERPPGDGAGRDRARHDVAQPHGPLGRAALRHRRHHRQRRACCRRPVGHRDLRAGEGLGRRVGVRGARREWRHHHLHQVRWNGRRARHLRGAVRSGHERRREGDPAGPAARAALERGRRALLRAQLDAAAVRSNGGLGDGDQPGEQLPPSTPAPRPPAPHCARSSCRTCGRSRPTTRCGR
jgi:hypothetical protein